MGLRRRHRGQEGSGVVGALGGGAGRESGDLVPHAFPPAGGASVRPAFPFFLLFFSVGGFFFLAKEGLSHSKLRVLVKGVSRFRALGHGKQSRSSGAVPIYFSITPRGR